MPGIPTLLATLAGQPDLVLGLLTGNVAMGAQLKLESFGIWHYFQLGAYGSDHLTVTPWYRLRSNGRRPSWGTLFLRANVCSSVIPRVTSPVHTRTALVQ